MVLAALRRISLEDKSTLLEPLKYLLEDIIIEDLKIPFAATSINLSEGKDVIFRNGSLLDAVYASSALEGVFPPFEIDGDLYSDGGPTSNIPVEACRELGADFVIAVYLPQTIRREGKFDNGLEVVLRADNIATVKLGKSMLDRADVVITPEVSDIHWAAFKKFEECIKLGGQASSKAVPMIKDGLKRRKSMMGRMKKLLKAKIDFE
jgi:NTE family protein